MTKDKLLCVKEIAAALGRSDKTIRRLFKKDELPGAFKLTGRSSHIKMLASDIEKLKRGER